MYLATVDWGDVDTKFQQLAMNAWRAPQRVVVADCPDQIPDVGRDRRPADTTARLATPVQTEAAAMPAHQRLRLEDNRGFKQARAQPIEPDEDQAICRAQPEPRRRGSLKHNKLLAEKCHLGFASRMRSEHSDEQSAEALQEVDHRDDESTPSRRLRQPGCDFRSNYRFRSERQGRKRRGPAATPATNECSK